MSSVTVAAFTISFFLLHTMSSVTVAVFTISFFISQTGAKPAIKTIKTEYGDIFDCVNIYKQPSLDHSLLQNHTLQTEYGDIFDCVNIYKQPSLDHSLLQNHTLQMKPSFIPEVLSPNRSTHEVQYSQFELDDGGCPDGFVPIRRVRKDDLRRVCEYLKEHPSALIPDSPGKPGWQLGIVITHKLGAQIKAARGLLNVCNPKVSKEQHSDSLVYVKIGKFESHNVIHAGWTVFPAVYSDYQTRLHTVWTADNYMKTGCVDMLCPGFVQISKTSTLGSVVQPTSQYGGTQYNLPITIAQVDPELVSLTTGYWQDQFSGNWWLITSVNVMVGYWPKELFTDLTSHAEAAGWGGRVYSPVGSSLPSPPMGSGHKAGEGYKKSCFVKETQFARAGRGSYEDLNADLLMNHVDNPSCYDVKLFMDSHDNANIFFGGPGGQCGGMV